MCLQGGGWAEVRVTLIARIEVAMIDVALAGESDAGTESIEI